LAQKNLLVWLQKGCGSGSGSKGKKIKKFQEKDLGVIVQDTVKQAAQCAKAARTAQSVLGQITRAFRYRDRKVFSQLYKQYVRPHLDFATQAWSSWQRADIEVLEKVQRAVNMVAGCGAANTPSA
jgi:predicted YcjX-like family ATPase